MGTAFGLPGRASRGQELTQLGVRDVVEILFVLLLSIVVLFARFWFGQEYLAFYNDDFFYYLQIARNIVAHGKSSFDGIHLTNGYHPLWLGVITLLYALSDKVVFVAVEVIGVVSVTASYVLARAFLLRSGVGRTAAAVCAFLIAFDVLSLARGGMEVIATLPLIFSLINIWTGAGFRWTARQTITLGLLGAGVILSRLDSAIFVVLAFVFCNLADKVSFGAWIRRFLLFSLGASPVVAYLLINHWLFGSFLPVSSHAKQLRFHHIPSPAPFAFLFVPLAVGKAIIVIPAIFATGCAMRWLLCQNSHLVSVRYLRSMVLACALFPLVHLSVLSVLSDWTLWPWYLYSFVPVVLVFGLFTECGEMKSSTVRKMLQAAYYVIPLLASTYICYFLVTWPKHGSDDIYQASRDLESFSASHPGIYAMGDRSGTVGYLINAPLIQLEGLVMDQPYLENIRQQIPLLNVLSKYGVRYYVASNATQVNGCYLVVEPQQAGPDSPVMRDRICTEPVARYWHSGVSTLIFDLQR
jgi:hypothetical protein